MSKDVTVVKCVECKGDVRVPTGDLPHINVEDVRCFGCGRDRHLARMAAKRKAHVK